MSKGDVLFAGVASWNLDEDSMEHLDVPNVLTGLHEDVLIAVRNGSPTVDLVVNVGHMAKILPYVRGDRPTLIGCTASAADDTFTTVVPHKLKVGDRVKFTGTGGGVTANLYYYVIAVTSEYIFKVSTTHGGTVVNLNDDAANVVDYVPSPAGEVAITSTQDVNATFTTTVDHGLTVGDAIAFTGTGGGVTAGTVYYVIATSTTKVFQVSTARGGAAFNVDADDETNAFSIVEEFFALTTIDVPKFAAGTTTAPVAGMVSALVQGWNGGRLSLEKSAAEAAAFNAVVEVRRI